MNGKDTVNKIDANDQKQGKWLIRGQDKPRSCFESRQVVETGQYSNNRKTGLWLEYYCNGKIRNKLTYVNGVLEGYAIFYEKNGSVLKEGSFKENHWVTDNKAKTEN